MNAKNAQKTLSLFLLSLLVLTSISILVTDSVQAQDLPVISDPEPADESTIDTESVALSVFVAQNDGHDLKVEFYEGSDTSGTEIGNVSVSGTESGTRADCPNTFDHGLDDGESTDWTAKAIDKSTDDYSTSTYSFTYQESNSAPDAPSTPSPSDGATDVGTDDVELSVSVSDPDGDSMDVTFYDANDDSEIGTVTDKSNGTANVHWYDLEYSTNYYWYAVADDGLETTTSNTWSFSTTGNSAPSASDPTPEDGAENVDHTDGVDLSIDVSDPDGDTMDVHFKDYSDGSTIDSVEGVNNGTYTVTWSGLEESTDYDWYVRVEDGVGYSESDTYTFTTVEINSAPVVDDRSPEDGAEDVDINKNLQITVDDPDGDDMVIEFYDASDHSIIKTLTDVHDGIYSIEWNKTYNTTYEWYVVVSDPHTETNTSTFSFTTEIEDTDDTTDDNTTEDTTTSGGSWTLTDSSSFFEDYKFLIMILIVLVLIVSVSYVKRSN